MSETNTEQEGGRDECVSAIRPILICTGWRGYNGAARLYIYEELKRLWHRTAVEPVIYVGDCKDGFDRLVREACDDNGWSYRVFVADWKSLGRSAGPNRNRTMIKTAIADVGGCGRDYLHCLALPHIDALRNRDKVSGTRGCFEMAMSYGIETTVVPVK